MRILAEGKTASICTDSQYAFGVAYVFGMLWKQRSFLTSRGDKIKNGSYVQNLLDVKLLPAALAIITVPGHFKSDSLEVKGRHLANTSGGKKATLRRPIG